jgi:hypothetical protein
MLHVSHFKEGQLTKELRIRWKITEGYEGYVDGKKRGFA